MNSASCFPLTLNRNILTYYLIWTSAGDRLLLRFLVILMFVRLRNAFVSSFFFGSISGWRGRQLACIIWSVLSRIWFQILYISQRSPHWLLWFCLPGCFAAVCVPIMNVFLAYVNHSSDWWRLILMCVQQRVIADAQRGFPLEPKCYCVVNISKQHLWMLNCQIGVVFHSPSTTVSLFGLWVKVIYSLTVRPLKKGLQILSKYPT